MRVPPGRRILGAGVLVVVGLVGAVLVVEALFRVAGLFVHPERLIPGLGRDHFVILCIGDSHTYGQGEGYPASLAKRLAERSDRYRVINLGVPGSNTAQVRKRLRHYLEQYNPRLVIHWAGINNAWNRTDTDVWSEAEIAPRSLGERLLDHSRIVRFVRVWRHHAELRRQFEQTEVGVTGKLTRNFGDPRQFFRRRMFGGAEEIFQHQEADALPADDITRVTTLDLRWMAAELQERGIPLVVITYPLFGGWFGAANEGIRQVARAEKLPLVESVNGIERMRHTYAGGEVPPGFDKSVHPTQPLYHEIGGLVLETLDQQHLLLNERQ